VRTWPNEVIIVPNLSQGRHLAALLLGNRMATEMNSRLAAERERIEALGGYL